MPRPVNCAGDTTTGACFFANAVSDVVVRPADANGLGGGQVLAAVGWQGGRLHLRQPDGTLSAALVQAPRNGIYASRDGRPGTFSYVDSGGNPSSNGFAPADVVGRTALSVARGAGQNHDLVYAIVQDAQKIAGCLDEVQAGLEVGTCLASGVKGPPTTLDGAYVSKDFGQTWTKVMDWSQLELPGTNSALGPYGTALGYAPGVQSWYNLWIEADPTATDAITRAPTRVVFGLEEVWENPIFGEPQNGASAAATPWRVIGRYWNACAFSIPGTQCNGASLPITGTTTHPDQHAGLFVPDGAGGVTLLVGNDGGAYLQHVSAGQDFSNDRWGTGANVGLATLLPYHLVVAKDGTVVAGLQDNGEMKITNVGQGGNERGDVHRAQRHQPVHPGAGQLRHRRGLLQRDARPDRLQLPHHQAPAPVRDPQRPDGDSGLVAPGPRGCAGRGGHAGHRVLPSNSTPLNVGRRV